MSTLIDICVQILVRNIIIRYLYYLFSQEPILYTDFPTNQSAYYCIQTI